MALAPTGFTFRGGVDPCADVCITGRPEHSQVVGMRTRRTQGTHDLARHSLVTKAGNVRLPDDDTCDAVHAGLEDPAPLLSVAPLALCSYTLAWGGIRPAMSRSNSTCETRVRLHWIVRRLDASADRVSQQQLRGFKASTLAEQRVIVARAHSAHDRHRTATKRDRAKRRSDSCPTPSSSLTS
jgi:hypothetical protein